MPRRSRNRLRPPGDPRGNCRTASGSPGIILQSPPTRVLLAHNEERRYRTRSEMRQMPEVRSCPTPTSRAAPLDHPPWPFAQWGVDIVGPLPRAKAQKKFAIVACDYFTKWIEAEAVASITQRSVEKFLWENVICRFGIPNTLIVDNGTQLTGKHITDFCNNLGIRTAPSSVSHPQTNGQTEASNKKILSSLKKRLDDSKGQWVEELPSTLWALRTTTHSGTQDTPFSLAFGTDAVIPAEIGIHTLRISRYDPDLNQDRLRHNLDMLNEVREDAMVKLAARQKVVE